MPVVAVVGLGPAGIVAARTLQRAGISVVAFQPEPAAAAARAPLASPPPTLRARADDDAVLQSAPPAGRDAIGGAKHLAAPQAYRLDPWSLSIRRLTRRRYGPAAASGLVDWPVGPSDLTPWYDLVERETGVDTRPPTAWTERMRSAAGRKGWMPFAAPAAASADMSGLLPRDGVEIVRATVTALRQDARGSVTGVEYIDDDGMTRTRPAAAVVVAASVIPTVRLLLLSDLRAQGQVGRWFLSHNTFAVHGHFAGDDLQRRAAGPASAVAIAEFEGDGFDHTSLGFLGGSLLQAAMTGPWGDGRMRATATALEPGVIGGNDPPTWVRANHRSIGSVWAQPDQLPREDNTIDLDPIHRDAAGHPVARITFALGDDDHRRHEYLAARAAEWLEAAGARHTWAAPLQPQPLGTHLYGGARMGADPDTSVVDSFGRFHGAPGLVVLGSATFPSTGGRGPVETIEALAWRSAAQLVDDLR